MPCLVSQSVREQRGAQWSICRQLQDVFNFNLSLQQPGPCCWQCRLAPRPHDHGGPLVRQMQPAHQQMVHPTAVLCGSAALAAGAMVALACTSAAEDIASNRSDGRPT
eukprot:CAMPEP_0115871212 /NCGR_PEP_ID=MMETSP0287-20121206/22745_1 /TAXON_ID=412157 /ORGANISM="Chrysochromulina rotalis, Strain UIO044" /LENGTH=107 /DNA_ID=CAMNT_0003325997 /DNA_START=155 /DNA_END=478 /DNA_ORIENTATION=-